MTEAHQECLSLEDLAQNTWRGQDSPQQVIVVEDDTQMDPIMEDVCMTEAASPAALTPTSAGLSSSSISRQTSSASLFTVGCECGPGELVYDELANARRFLDCFGTPEKLNAFQNVGSPDNQLGLDNDSSGGSADEFEGKPVSDEAEVADELEGESSASDEAEVADELEGESSADEFEGEPIADEFEGKPISDEAEVAHELEGESSADEFEGEPIADEFEGKPVSDEAEGPVPDELEGEPVADEAEGEPTADELEGELIGDEFEGEPVADEGEGGT